MIVYVLVNEYVSRDMCTVHTTMKSAEEMRDRLDPYHHKAFHIEKQEVME